MNRREFIATTSAGAIVPFLSLPAGAASVSRRYRAYLGSSNAGTQTISVARQGGGISVTNRTELVAKLLGIPVYRYTLNSTEIWKDGVIQSISARGKDNGTSHFVNAQRVSGGLQVEGSKFKGLVAGNPTSSSFFISDLVGRKTWISTQTGRPIKVAVTKRGKTTFQLKTGTVPCSHYHFAGELKLPVDAYFAENGDLLGYMFDIKGKRARIIAETADPAFRPVWG